ncbi:MAG: 1,4-dihydroxy-2-naphthoate polyprenyltransferase [Bacteroidales bacterium]|nr:1,4-dihydroxy-2-naphthoate polyprenyltransferase [Bacteroidales bacterium]
MKNKWIHAARPKTLTAASMPVLTATALAWFDGTFKPIAALSCIAFALLAQIAANFANDYFDFKGGIDTDERLGPARAVASGWITPKAMLRATFLMLVLACLCGLALILYGGWTMIWVGLACIVFAVLYSTGPYPLSRYGMGDIFVLVFFGFVPVLFTYYVQINSFPISAWLLGGMMGLLSINILITNNYRDIETDRKTNKYTSIVLLGKGFGKWLYFSTGVAASTLFCLFFWLQNAPFVGSLSVLFLVLHITTWREMIRIDRGRELNKILGLTSRNLLVFAILYVFGMWLVK